MKKPTASTHIAFPVQLWRPVVHSGMSVVNIDGVGENGNYFTTSHISAVHIQNHFRLQSLRILITFTCAVITLQHVTITTVTVEGTISVDTLVLTSSIGYSTLINI